LIPRLFKEE